MPLQQPQMSQKSTAFIRLWSLQPREVWLSLQRRGSLRVNRNHPEFLQHLEDFHDPYEWMRRQMAARIPGYRRGFPWWAYTYRVDLRIWRHYAPQGQPWVRLELKLPRERVLLSRYDTWHFVLSRWYLPESFDDEPEAEDIWSKTLIEKGLNPRMPLPEPWHSEMVHSWDQIFTLDETSPAYTVQAVFEKLELKDVVGVREYTGTSLRLQQ